MSIDSQTDVLLLENNAPISLFTEERESLVGTSKKKKETDDGKGLVQIHVTYYFAHFNLMIDFPYFPDCISSSDNCNTL